MAAAGNQEVKLPTHLSDCTLMDESIVWYIIIAFVWGVTNALMKNGVQGLEKVKAPSLGAQILAELNHLIKNWKYVVPFIINQSGSLLFYFAVAKNDISTAVPIVNSLTMVVTIMTGCILGEKLQKGTIAGVSLVLLGVSICISEK